MQSLHVEMAVAIQSNDFELYKWYLLGGLASTTGPRWNFGRGGPIKQTAPTDNTVRLMAIEYVLRRRGVLLGSKPTLVVMKLVIQQHARIDEAIEAVLGVPTENYKSSVPN